MSNPSIRSSSPVLTDVRNPVVLKRGLLIYATLVLILGWSYGLWQIQADRERTLAGSSNQLIMTATILAGHLEAMINDGVGAAAAGATEIQSLDSSSPLSPAEMSIVLGRMLTGGEYVHTLFVVNRTMFIDAQRGVSTLKPNCPAWAVPVLTTTGDTWIGKPVYPERGDMGVLIPVAKRTISIRGEPTWSGALFSIYSLDQMFRSLPIERGAVSLVTLDGTILIRLPTTPGVNYAGMDLRLDEAYRKFIQTTPQPLTLVARDPISSKPRQFAIRQVKPYSVVAVSGRNVEDSLLAWQQRRLSSIWTLSFASIALVLLTGVLHVLLQRRFEAITRSEQRFQLAVAGTSDGIWELDFKTDQMYFSPRYRQLLDMPDIEDLTPTREKSWLLTHVDDRRLVEVALRRHLSHREPYDVEHRLLTRGDQYKWFRARGQAEWDEQGNAVRMAGSISDIHDKRMAEENLEKARQAELNVRQELTMNLLLAQEQERLRLANELHDSVGQNLSLIKNHALLLQQHRDLPPAVTRHVTALEELATEVIAEVRTVAHNLRPLHIEELGLTDAMNTLIAKVNRPGNLVIEGHLEEVQDVIHGVVATHLYRIAQEALNNTLKHANALRCRVTLERDINCVRLIIEDDGVGFDPDKPGAAHGIGLSSIAERARILNATLRVTSAPGKGTTIHLEVPVTEAATNVAD